MNKRIKKIMSVFCALTMAVGVLFTGAPTALAASAGEKVRELSHNAYLRNITGVNLTHDFSKVSTEFETFDILSADTQRIDIGAEPEDPRATVQISGNDNLVSGLNRISIVVTAENGFSTREYTVIVYRRESDALSSNADLKAIRGLDLNEEFAKDRLNYTAVVPENVMYLEGFGFETDHIEAQAYASGIYEELNIGENIIKINVAAQDGTTKEYSIIVTRQGDKEQLQSNADLQGIYGLDLEETFDKSKTEYTANVSNDVEHLYSLYAVAEDRMASVYIENQYEALKVGENLINIKVIAQNGTEKVYRLVVIRGERRPLSSNANLRLIKGVQLNEAFDKNNSQYTASVGRDVSRLDITAEAEDKNASIFIYGNEYLSLGDNLINIDVYAEDGTSKRYVIKVNRGNISSNTKIRSITGIDLDQTYSNDRLSYHSQVANNVTSLDINVVTEDSTATVVINGQAKALNVGINFIQVIVTAESGASRQVNITVEREGSTEVSSNADISDISGNVIVNEKITANKLDYTASWDSTDGFNEMNIEADESAEIRVSGISADGSAIIAQLQAYYRGISTFGIENITTGVNTLTVQVIAQSGAVKIYTINITK